MTTATGSDAILDRMMTLHPKVIDLTLDRMHRLLAALGHPENRLPPVIHIAGTNGKGSVSAALASSSELACFKLSCSSPSATLDGHGLLHCA